MPAAIWIAMKDISDWVRTRMSMSESMLQSDLGLWLIRNSCRSPWAMCSNTMHWGSS